MLPALALLFSLSGSPRTAVAPPVTPVVAVTSCTAIGTRQIEAALGQHLNVGPAEHGRYDSTCSYAAGSVAVTISIRHLTEALDLAAEIGNLKAAFPGSKLRAVKSLGGQAFELEIPGAGTQLHVLPVDREYLLISVLGIEAGHHGADAATKIARAALRRF